MKLICIGIMVAVTYYKPTVSRHNLLAANLTSILSTAQNFAIAIRCNSSCSAPPLN